MQWEYRQCRLTDGNIRFGFGKDISLKNSDIIELAAAGTRFSVDISPLNILTIRGDAIGMKINGVSFDNSIWGVFGEWERHLIEALCGGFITWKLKPIVERGRRFLRNLINCLKSLVAWILDKPGGN